ncbi:hypothetical protein Ataiwa_27520 [Algoriphagus taiwanensis]|uniref:Uncharacterized protein n=1 Tax=Algoriphagus taiwanensis TaxID=1445656 RepID=A0ABQ6Q4J0_9BACT|nr:hypothetical protein Ataiwa_27520 [Algoriphagus taiwanensis]
MLEDNKKLGVLNNLTTNNIFFAFHTNKNAKNISPQ